MGSDNILAERTLPDGRKAFIMRMTYGKARLYVESLNCGLSRIPDIDNEY